MRRARGKVLCVRVNPELYRMLSNLADRNDLVLSDLVRWILVMHFHLQNKFSLCQGEIENQFRIFVQQARKPLWYR